jgi:hypothetical protein
VDFSKPLTHLPTGGVDMLVFDPPYKETPVPHLDHKNMASYLTNANKREVVQNERYGNVSGLNIRCFSYQICAGKDHAQVLDLYASFAALAQDALKPGGILLVKCQDSSCFMTHAVSDFVSIFTTFFRKLCCCMRAKASIFVTWQ